MALSCNSRAKRLRSSTTANSRSLTAREEVEQQIAAIQARNTPATEAVAKVTHRGGEAGIQSLSIQSADFTSSTMFRDKYRVALTARPTYLDAGKADGTGQLRFGLLPAGTSFEQQTASGLAAEVQISDDTFGLMLGATPRGFLVNNVTAGARFTPGGGPVSFLFNRSPVQQTMLSFAGQRDPVTKTIWGGVMSNAFTAQGDWGNQDTGFYGRVTYQYLNGRNVASNTAMDGSAGAWWKLFRKPDNDLTLGVNFTAMHYDKNLRYFTLGQGGYFSPQRYFLFNIPITWEGNWNRRLEYKLSGTFGAQHVEESASPFFPTMPELQGRKGPMYQRSSGTGANYGIDANVSYQATPNWQIGGWLGLNNSLNYTWQGAGFFIQYKFHERPLGSPIIPSLPDWAGERGKF